VGFCNQSVDIMVSPNSPFPEGDHEVASVFVDSRFKGDSPKWVDAPILTRGVSIKGSYLPEVADLINLLISLDR
jgi:hypothetical protein